MALKLPWVEKRMFWAFENDSFQFFANLWVTKLKPFSGKVRQSKLLWGKKRIFWAFWNDISHFFANFWVRKLKLFSKKVRQNIENFLNLNLIVESFLEICFEAILRSKQMSWAFGNGISHFIGNFWVTELKPIFGKAKQSLWNSVNPNLVIKRNLDNSFEGNLWLKANVLNRWTWYFSVFCKFLICKVDSIF